MFGCVKWINKACILDSRLGVYWSLFQLVGPFDLGERHSWMKWNPAYHNRCEKYKNMQSLFWCRGKGPFCCRFIYCFSMHFQTAHFSVRAMDMCKELYWLFCYAVTFSVTALSDDTGLHKMCFLVICHNKMYSQLIYYITTVLQVVQADAREIKAINSYSISNPLIICSISWIFEHG